MNTSNFTNSSILSAPSPSSISNFSETFPYSNTTAPSPPSNTSAPSPLSIDTAPSSRSQIPAPAHFERFNHTSQTSGTSIEQRELNFFFVYVGLSFCACLLIIFFARKTLYTFIFDSRKYVDVAAGDTELKPVSKYRAFKSGGATKNATWDELEDFEGLEHKEREVGEGVSV